MENRLGILAGKGELPWIATKNAILKGEDPIVLLLTNESPPEEFRDRTHKVILTKFYTSVIKTLKKFNVTRIVSIGKIHKTILYENSKFDLRTLFLLFKMHNKNDYTIFLYLEKVLSKYNIQILPQTLYLEECFLKEGRYGRKLTNRELEDISFGMFYAKKINELDIGQCVVVGDKIIWAVEGPEGTDECIKRGGQLFKKKRGVVCKVAKKNHDPRFDIPVIGIQTLYSMKDSNCTVLAIEANSTIVVNKEEFLNKAKEFNITVFSIQNNFFDKRYLKKINKNWFIF